MHTERARATLYEWVQSDSLRKHCEAVAASMEHMARKNGADPDLWCAVGLLHDMDYERYPDMPPSGPATTAVSEALVAGEPVDEASLPGHPFVGVHYLRGQGWSSEVLRAILSHADFSGITPESPMERTLYAVDELSGFVTAVALVRPDKSVHSLEASSVRKKFKDKAFAAKVNREDMLRGAEYLGVPIEELIGEVILALRARADVLGLSGIRD
jgi:putative nucleotidyltransferase with HDIG domain